MYVQKVEPGAVTPVKSGGGAAAAYPPTPPTARKAAPVKVEDGRPKLDALLQEMGIDLERLQNAASGKCASQNGLNMPEMQTVLQHFDRDASGCRADLNSELSLLLRSFGL